MISRRELMFAAPAVLAAQRSGTAGRAPNVIVIIADDLGCTDIGCFGASDLKTPNLDQLAASGVRWKNWYSNAPVCAPARGSILTGRFPQRNGVTTNGKELAPDQKTLAELLKPAGYETAAIGKWHLGSTEETRPNAHGFDYFYGFHSGCVDFYSHRYYWGEPRRVNYHDLWRNRTEINEGGQYLTERITAEAVNFVAKKRDKPFFAYIAYNAPHYPMHAPEKYTARFPDLAPERRVYAAMIAAVDDGIGEIRQALRRQGVLENTLIMFAGDNGATTEKRAGLDQNYAEAGSNGPYRGFKFSLFDGGMHVPAIMSWPGRIPPKQTNTEIVMSMDIVPTALDAAGVKLPSGYTLDGSSLLRVAAEGAKSPHPWLAWASGAQQAIRRGDWKLVVNGRVYGRSPDGNKPLEGDDALFLSNLANDPGETKNLRRAHPEIVDELSTLLGKWRAEYSSE
jgi:arylsulfatase A-like enzyme